MNLKDKLDQIDLTDIYETLHPKVEDCIFFSSAHGTFSRLEHILGHNTSPNKVKKSEVMSSNFSNHNGMKLEINYKK